MNLEPTRVTGGITFQPVFTFRDRLRSLAEEVRDSLHGGSPSSTWPPKGFEVSLDLDVIRLSHVRHSRWLAILSESDFLFQYDTPDASQLHEFLRVQAEATDRLRRHLGTVVRTIGIKLHAVVPVNLPAPESISALVPVGLDDTLGGGESYHLTAVAIRTEYELGPAIAHLEVSARGSRLGVDLDCACTDIFAVPEDALSYFEMATSHFLVNVGRYVEGVAGILVTSTARELST